MTTETQNNYIIDASGKRLGNVATEAARVMLGKNDPQYTRHTIANVKVEITNASKLDIPEHKETEIYQSYSGYPGGRKTETLQHLADRLGYSEVVRRTVGGMLPNNKHKRILLNNLIVSE
jgi:large subunit ribosomal protein L13